ERAGRRADRNAEQRIEEQHTDQQAPEAALGSARGGGVDELVQLDLAGIGLGRDHHVAELDEILLLHGEELAAHLFGLDFTGIDDGNESGHVRHLVFGWGSGVPTYSADYIPACILPQEKNVVKKMM